MMTQVTYLQNPQTGETLVRVGDEVEDEHVRFFVGAINDSHNLCSIDKTKPWTVKTTTDPMRKCMESGNYAVNAARLRIVPDNAESNGRASDPTLRYLAGTTQGEKT